FAFAEPDGLVPSSPAGTDLALVMAFLGSSTDYVAIGASSSSSSAAVVSQAGEWRDWLQELGLGGPEGLPQVIGLDEALNLGLPPTSWQPWLWSEKVADEIGGSPPGRLPEAWKELHGKTWAAECHTAWQRSHADQCAELIAAMAGRAQTDTNHPIQAEEDVPGSLPCRTRQ
ncbi:unnamed protein product, partial [Polarella glacialis]